MGREGMSYDVRRKAHARDPSLSPEPPEIRPEGLPCHHPPAPRWKEDLTTGTKSRAGIVEIVHERHQGLATEGHKALVPSFPNNTHQSASKIELPDLERDELGHAQAGGVEQLDHRMITNPEGRLTIRRREESLDLALAENPRQ